MRPIVRPTTTGRPSAARRDWVLRLPDASISLLAVLVVLGLGGALVAATGVNPLAAFAELLGSAFGSRNGIAETLVKTTPLLLAGLGVAVAYRARLVNVGAEGQIYLGAIGATYVGLFLGPLPPSAGIPLALLAGFVAGALWAGIAAILRLRFGASELITTLMLNYIAIQLVSYLVSGPWKDPKTTDAFSAIVNSGIHLPTVMFGTRLHAGLLVAVAAALCLWYVFRNTVFGFQLEVAGASDEAARYSGIPTGRLILVAMMLSGALAGLAGAIEVAGLHHRLLPGLSPGYGYTAIAVAMLGGSRPLGVLVAAVLFAALAVGGDGMQQISRVPVQIVDIIAGLILLVVLAAEYVRNRRQVALAKMGSG